MIALIDYGMGNLLSVYKAFQACGADIEITSDPGVIADADAVVLPGVGHFGDGMKHLSENKLDLQVTEAIRQDKPFFGICLGMQLLMEFSEEAPNVKGLGVFKGGVLRFPESSLKVPHMGWNNISLRKNNSRLFQNIDDESYFYFVHSYYVSCRDDNIIAAECSYGINFTAALTSGNIFATQFHPEKSQDKGLQVIKNFIDVVNS